MIIAAVDRTEKLARDLDPTRNYPDEFVFFRVTGQRPALGISTQSPGDAVLADLACLVERLCDSVQLKPAEIGDALAAPDLCARWSISRKTLDRMRRRGLIGRRVEGADGVVRILFMPETVAWFQKTHQDELGRAARFTRIPLDAQARIIRNAARYKKWAGLTLNASALLLARRMGRSHEAVRQVLRRHDSKHPDRALFDEAPPVNAKRRTVLFRAWRMGVPLAAMAKKYRRSLASIRRGIGLERAERLRAHLADGSLEGPILPTFSLPEAEEVLLASRAVRTELGEPGERVLSRLLAPVRDRPLPPIEDERTRLVAYHFLRHRVLESIRSLDRAHPQAQTIDRAETFLRWASRLKVELMRPHIPVMLDTIEGRLGRPLADTPLPAVVRILSLSWQNMGRVIDMGDPLRSGRLAAAIGLSLDRVFAKWVREQPVGTLSAAPGKATPRPPAGTVVADWTRTVSPWQVWTELPERVVRLLEADRLDPDEAALLRSRYGLGGQQPLTVSEWAERVGQSPIRAAILEHTAYGNALRLANRAARP